MPWFVPPLKQSTATERGLATTSEMLVLLRNQLANERFLFFQLGN
jgi:hypothetical protein